MKKYVRNIAINPSWLPDGTDQTNDWFPNAKFIVDNIGIGMIGIITYNYFVCFSSNHFCPHFFSYCYNLDKYFHAGINDLKKSLTESQKHRIFETLLCLFPAFLWLIDPLRDNLIRMV